MPSDPNARALTEFLRAAGADELPHGGGRTLLEHLTGVYDILLRWQQPEWLALAGLIHSVYGTEAYARRLLSRDRRPELATLAGERTERVAHLFSRTPRAALVAGTHRWARGLSADSHPASRAELDALLLVHMANIAEQSRAGDGFPGRWLVRVRELAEHLLDSDGATVPRFVAGLLAVEDEDEALAARSYRAGLAAHESDAAQRIGLFAQAAAAAPVAEPCAWLAHDAARRGDLDSARSWGRLGRERLEALGTAWDKRLSYEEWLARLCSLETGGESETPPPAGADRGRARFVRYVASLAGAEGREQLGPIYPDLPSRPWYDPQAFALARRLEERFPEISAELLALDPDRFHPESERIARGGDWDVAFFYERGRRRDEVCAACPVTTAAIESSQAMRTMTGLIYASRMRPGTHVHPHRGPTNLRLRCHLAVLVPDGDCGIRVGEETRRWQAGRCLVFDDHFEHEAWNRTDGDRIVLVVDLWHPALAPVEIALLEGLHGYALAHARSLGSYWAANAAAARGGRS